MGFDVTGLARFLLTGLMAESSNGLHFSNHNFGTGLSFFPSRIAPNSSALHCCAVPTASGSAEIKSKRAMRSDWMDRSLKFEGAQVTGFCARTEGATSQPDEALHNQIFHRGELKKARRNHTGLRRDTQIGDQRALLLHPAQGTCQSTGDAPTSIRHTHRPERKRCPERTCNRECTHYREQEHTCNREHTRNRERTYNQGHSSPAHSHSRLTRQLRCR